MNALRPEAPPMNIVENFPPAVHGADIVLLRPSTAIWRSPAVSLNDAIALIKTTPVLTLTAFSRRVLENTDALVP